MILLMMPFYFSMMFRARMAVLIALSVTVSVKRHARDEALMMICVLPDCVMFIYVCYAAQTSPD